MDAFIEILASYGYWGMFLAAFLAGSVFPFSSETVMVVLLGSGLDGWQLVVYGSIGNTLGSVFNYFVGRMGKTEWIEKYLRIKKKNMDRARRFMAGRGAWMGFFAFLPIIGSAITVTLGFMRANIPISFLSIAIGKFLRYWLLVYGANSLFG
ncbi:MAG: DedA family protein [Prevotella sp.]|nr:DedA family protein [Prevotella sp.]